MTGEKGEVNVPVGFAFNEDSATTTATSKFE
jgi:hypothetical protein